MAPPDILDEAAPAPASAPGPTSGDGAPADDGLRVELVHRHLMARLAVAQEQMQALEEQSMAPEALIARFVAIVSDAQRTLDAEREEAMARADARRRSADSQAAALVARAAGEARTLRAVAAELRSSTPAPRAGSGAPPLADLDLSGEVSAT